MSKHPEERWPEALEREPDGRELRQTWELLEEVGERRGTTSPEATDEAWLRLSRRLGLADAQGASTAVDAPASATVERPRPSPDAEEARGVGPSGGAAGREAPGRARRVWLRVAAVAVLALGTTAVWQSVPVVRSAPAAGRVAFDLPDGSEVVLNAGSTLEYRRGFDLLPGVPADRRAVRLQGEAFFDVTPGSRPFEVSAGSARVTVLGTRFNVRARPAPDGPPAVRVAVEEGRVRVALERADVATEIGAGEAVRLDPVAETLEPETVSVDRIAAWRSGGLTVVDEPLGSVVEELEVRYGIDISLADSVDGSSRVSVYYPVLGTPESVLGDLATQQSLRMRRTAAGWELF